LGDSHTSAALDPALFTEHLLSALNYSRGGHYAEFNTAFYLKYRREYGPPRVVLISAPYFIFANGSEATAILSLLSFEELTNYYVQNQKLSIPNFYRYNALFQEAPLYAGRLVQGEYNALMHYGYQDELDATFRTKDLTISKLITEAATTLTSDYRSGYSKTARKNSTNLKFLQRLLNHLYADKVTVFLVETPEYIGTQEYIQGKDVFYREIQDELLGYPNTTFVAQTAIMAIDPGDKTLFSDGDYGNGNSHLSYKGSQLYTKEIINTILEKLK